ncbi:MAG: hypothetical protein NC102_07215 [Clostridium sp.]|nr:hypothetical protein [Clostridium sp.]
MMTQALLQKIALRHRALYLPDLPSAPSPVTASTAHCLQQLRRCGFTLAEDALRAFNALPPSSQGLILETINDALGVNLNWNPLVKGWLEPTGEGLIDHLATAYANFLRERGIWTDGVTLPCGHLIPNGTFNLERYNGCPFCGRPFRIGDEIFYGQASKLKELKRWADADLQRTLTQLAESTIPLDATAREDLKGLLQAGIKLPEQTKIPVKENAIIIASDLIDNGQADRVGALMQSPADVLRLLWYRHTGHIQVIEPGTIVKNTLLANSNRFTPYSSAGHILAAQAKRDLRLHYGRSECRMAAQWLNSLEMSPKAACAIMHPKRGMWTRFIRALRLAEYAKKPGFERLAAMLRVWWDESYAVTQGKIDMAIRQGDRAAALAILKHHPGLFARQLFSSILADPDAALEAFRAVLPDVPLRLVIELGRHAERYFSPSDRVVKTLTGKSKVIPANPAIARYTEKQLQSIAHAIQNLSLDFLRRHYANNPERGVKIYIDPELDSMVLPLGDRSAAVQAFSSVPQGTKFPVEGDSLRLFLNWGEGLAAAPIDLDLSAKIIYPGGVEDCSYYNLSPYGARHSGDIRQIPDKVGTAEYIELDLNALRERGAEYVVFVASHYSGGTLDVNTRVGWMDSKYPMKVSNSTGVAFDPSTVQHMVKVAPTSLTRSLTFGMLDVKENEVTWLELGSDDQAAFTVSLNGIQAMLQRLKSKPTIGKTLAIMANARGMEIVDDPARADRVYTRDWALDIPQVIADLLS